MTKFLLSKYARQLLPHTTLVAPLLLGRTDGAGTAGHRAGRPLSESLWIGSAGQVSRL